MVVIFSESEATMAGPQAFSAGSSAPGMRALRVSLCSLLLIWLTGCAGLSGGSHGGSLDFSLSASPGSQTVVAGNGAGFTVAVSPAAMIGAVNLSVSGLPAGVEAAFTPGFDVNGSRTLNIFTTTTTPASTSRLTITATGASGTRTTTVNLAITPAADFMLSVTPNSQTVKPGGSADYKVNVTFAGSASDTVKLSVLGLPDGASAGFDHSSVTGTGTAILTVSADPTAPTAIAPLDVIGIDSAGKISVPIAFSIIPADFYLFQAVGPVEVNAGGVVTGPVLVVGLFATPGTVNLSTGALPAGITATFSPSVITGEGTSTIAIATDVSTPPGTYSLPIQGVDASGHNSTEIPFTVAPSNPNAGFFLYASPLEQQIRAGDSAFFNVNVSVPNGPVPPLTFTVSIPQSGVDGNVFPTGKGPGSYGLQISTSPFVPTTSVRITITATGPNGSQSLSVDLAIDATPVGP